MLEIVKVAPVVFRSVTDLAALNVLSGQWWIAGTAQLRIICSAVPGQASGTGENILWNFGSGAAQLIGTVSIPPAPFGIRGARSFNLVPMAETVVTLTFTPTALRLANQVATVMADAVNHRIAHLDLQGLPLALSRGPRQLPCARLIV